MMLSLAGREKNVHHNTIAEGTGKRRVAGENRSKEDLPCVRREKTRGLSLVPGAYNIG